MTDSPQSLSPVTETLTEALRLAAGTRSDGDAQLMALALDEIERLRADYRFLTESWHTAKRNQFAAEAAASVGLAQTGQQPVAWRWRTLPRFRESGDDGAWTLTAEAPNFINPRHHEIEPLFAPSQSSTGGNSK